MAECGSDRRGQSLVEVVIGVAVGVIMVAAAVAALVPSLIVNTQVNELQVAVALGKELFDNVRVLAEADWNSVYSPPLGVGTSAHYYLSTSTSPFSVVSGDETFAVGTSTYTRYFYVEHACRKSQLDQNSEIAVEVELAGVLVCPGGAPYSDPSTMQITVMYQPQGKQARSLTTHLIRYRSRVLSQTDWFGGPGDEGPRVTPTARFSTSTNIKYASTTGSIFLGPAVGGTGGIPGGSNISTSTNEHWAWNDLVGWMQWRDWPAPDMLGIRVMDDRITRFASSSDGYFSFDCETSPNGNICPALPSPPWRVTNDGSGYLKGWAWNDTYGWASFSCANHPPGCAASNYGVRIDGDGYFHDYAWNDVVGWVSFNCGDYDYCLTSDYKVRTDWRPIAESGTLISTTFDTGVSSSSFNSFLWYGDKPGDSKVGFQIAVSDSPSGPWNFLGRDGTGVSYYGETSNTGESVPIRYNEPRGRYFRYRVRLQSTITEPRQSPRVDDIIVGWSP